jgi:hypothetical protein
MKTALHESDADAAAIAVVDPPPPPPASSSSSSLGSVLDDLDLLVDF